MNVNAYQQAFGQRIRELRKRQHATLENLAHDAEIHVTYLSGIERGIHNPSLKIIVAIAAQLGVPMAELFDFHVDIISDNDAPPPPPPPRPDRVKTYLLGWKRRCRRLGMNESGMARYTQPSGCKGSWSSGQRESIIVATTANTVVLPLTSEMCPRSSAVALLTGWWIHSAAGALSFSRSGGKKCVSATLARFPATLPITPMG